jgi:GTP-binding protein Era
VPYALTVETDRWQELDDGSVRIEQTIFVRRDSQKAIVLGRGGQRIRSVGEAARKELAALLAREVHLFLYVKVREDWPEDPERYAALGLEYGE